MKKQAAVEKRNTPIFWNTACANNPIIWGDSDGEDAEKYVGKGAAKVIDYIRKITTSSSAGKITYDEYKKKN